MVYVGCVFWSYFLRSVVGRLFAIVACIFYDVLARLNKKALKGKIYWSWITITLNSVPWGKMPKNICWFSVIVNAFLLYRENDSQERSENKIPLHALEDFFFHVFGTYCLNPFIWCWQFLDHTAMHSHGIKKKMGIEFIISSREEFTFNVFAVISLHGILTASHQKLCC